MTKKKMNIICFDYAEYEHKLTIQNTLFEDIKTVLVNSKTINERVQNLEKESDGETNFIANYEDKKDGLFCLFIHMKKGGAHKIKVDLLEKPTFSITEVEDTENSSYSGYIKGYTYFYITRKNLIMKSSREIKEDEVFKYLEFLLRENNTTYNGQNEILSYGFHISDSVDITQIKSFETGKDLVISESKPLETIKQSVTTRLKDLLSVEGLPDIDPTEIISASIVFKIKQTKKDDLESQKVMMQQMLNIFNSEEVKIRDKNNKIVELGKAKTVKEISVQVDALGYPDSVELLKEMENLFKEIKND